jgi:hypothetical protein
MAKEQGETYRVTRTGETVTLERVHNDSHNQRATDLDRQAANILPVCVNGLV